MALQNSAALDLPGTRGELGSRTAPDDTRNRIPRSAGVISWSAILAGAAAAAALSLILLILGTGLGLSSVSPWANSGVSAKTLGVSTILWLTFTQLVASGMGGYLAGRLRMRWLAVDTDEIYFRDSAHGFLAWAIASLATATLLSSAIGTIVGGGIQVGAGVATAAATSAMAGGAAIAGAESTNANTDSAGPMAYFVDALFRKTPASAPASPSATGAPTSASPVAPGTGTAVEAATPAAASSVAEVARIFMNSLRLGTSTEEDIRYVAQVVAQRTGLTQQEAERRVVDTFARAQASLNEAQTAAREAADQARKGAAYAALWLFVALLIGAFVASLSAIYGGRQRDVQSSNFAT